MHISVHIYVYGTSDCLKIEKGARRDCLLSPSLLKLYAEHVMRNAELDELQAGIKIGRRNINNLRYVYDTTLMAERITYSPEYCTQQGSHSSMNEKSKAFQTSKSWENSARTHAAAPPSSLTPPSWSAVGTCGGATVGWSRASQGTESSCVSPQVLLQRHSDPERVKRREYGDTVATRVLTMWPRELMFSMGGHSVTMYEIYMSLWLGGTTLWMSCQVIVQVSIGIMLRVYQFIQHICLSVCCEPSTVPGTGERMVNKNLPCPLRAWSL